MAGKTVDLNESMQRLNQRFADSQPKVEIHDNLNVVDGLEPRITLNVGITLPLPGSKYKMVRADAGLTISKPNNMTTEETFIWLEDQLLDKVGHAVEHAMEILNQ